MAAALSRQSHQLLPLERGKLQVLGSRPRVQAMRAGSSEIGFPREVSNPFGFSSRIQDILGSLQVASLSSGRRAVGRPVAIIPVESRRRREVGFLRIRHLKTSPMLACRRGFLVVGSSLELSSRPVGMWRRPVGRLS